MFDKSFLEMAAVDVSKYVRERDGIKYLPWVFCKKLLHEHGAETVMFWPVPGPDGTSLHYGNLVFTDGEGRTNRCYEVVVHIQVDQIQWEITYPVRSGNYAVKDNTMNSVKVADSVRRAFVKGVAERLGLGFSLWELDDELPNDGSETEGDTPNPEDAQRRRRYLQELITQKLKVGLDYGLILSRIGLTEDGLKELFSAEDPDLERIEKAIEVLKKWGVPNNPQSRP